MVKSALVANDNSLPPELLASMQARALNDLQSTIAAIQCAHILQNVTYVLAYAYAYSSIYIYIYTVYICHTYTHSTYMYAQMYDFQHDVTAYIGCLTPNQASNKPPSSR